MCKLTRISEDEHGPNHVISKEVTGISTCLVIWHTQRLHAASGWGLRDIASIVNCCIACVGCLLHLTNIHSTCRHEIPTINSFNVRFWSASMKTSVHSLYSANYTAMCLSQYTVSFTVLQCHIFANKHSFVEAPAGDLGPPTKTSSPSFAQEREQVH